MGGWEACLGHFLNYICNFKEPQHLHGRGRSSTGENSEIYTVRDPHPRLLHKRHGKVLQAVLLFKVFRQDFCHFPSVRFGQLTAWYKTFVLNNVSSCRGLMWWQRKATASATSKPIHSSLPMKILSSSHH